MITIDNGHVQDGDVQPDVWSAWRCQWNKKGDTLLAKTQVGISLSIVIKQFLFLSNIAITQLVDNEMK